VTGLGHVACGEPSPDHSTFSRFRSRLSEEAKRELSSLVLQEFAKNELDINEGVASGHDHLVGQGTEPVT